MAGASYEDGFKLSDVLAGDVRADAKQSDLNILDSDWVKSRFMVSDNELPEENRSDRYKSTATVKFTDTSLGGNITINPRPQFTRYADIREKGMLDTRQNTSLYKQTGIGMGRYYSEAIDDNAQSVFLEFGMPKFNSMSEFFMRAIDYNDAVIANTGRSSTMYNIGKTVGAIAMLAAFPIITLSVWAFKTAAHLFFGSGNFKYYYLEPRMHLYWGTVNTIVTDLATEMGILDPIFMDDGSAPANPEKTNVGTKLSVNQDDIDEFKSLLPGVIGENNYIDVFSIATRAQGLANRQKIKEYEMIEANEPGESPLLSTSKKKQAFQNSLLDHANYYSSFQVYLNKINGFLSGEEKGDATPTTAPEEKADQTIADGVNSNIKSTSGQYEHKISAEQQAGVSRFVSALDSSVRQGGAFAAFTVDYTGATSESFSNSVGEINIGENMKQLSRKSRNLKFDLAGGNVVDGVGAVMGGLKDLAAGALDSVSFGLSNVISTMTGGGYIEIPKKWEDSDMQLPTITYNMQLVSPYGNTISQLQNLYIPLAMLLAGALPLATGKSSYTSPYLCSLFSKGVQKVQLGMITSLSITRGTSNLAFDKHRRPLAIDVSFQVTDFSTIVAAPVNGSVFDIDGLFNASLEDDTPLGNYIAVLGGRDILTNKYAAKKMRLKASRLLMRHEQALSPASMGMRMGMGLDSTLGALVSTRTLTGNYLN